jgi:putative endonuclease
MTLFKLLYVYILKCSDNTYYTGVTNNIETRLRYHNEGTDKEAYTFSRRPLTLVYYESFSEYNQAIAREKQIKDWSRKKKEAIIEQNWEKLKEFAACMNLTNYTLHDKK